MLSPSLVNEFRFGFRRLKVDKVPLTREYLAEKFGIKGVQQFERVTGLPRFALAGKIGYQNLGEASFAPNWKVSQGYQYLDDWKLTPDLTLNLGLRYELTSPWFDKFNNMNKINIEPGSGFGRLLLAAERGDSWSDRALVNTDTNNWAPRVGLAYRLGDRWTLRAGAGIFYGGQESLGASARMVVNWPFHVQKILRSTKTKPALLLKNGVPPNFLDPGDSLPEDIQLTHWAANFPILTTYQWNFSVQRQLTPRTVLKFAYVGSSTNFIPEDYDWNAPGIGDPATGAQRRVYPDIGTINYRCPYAHGSYHGLDLQFEKRFARGFSLLTSYTWGHSIDNVQELFGPEGGSLQDKNNWSADRATSGYDIRHQLVTSYIYELPFGQGRPWLDHGGVVNQILGGWQLSGITLMRTGLPFTPSVPNARDFLGTTGVGTWRPDRIGTGTVATPTPDRWFDASAFVQPCDSAGCRYGNSGRNILSAGGQINFDFGLTKNFPINERSRLQFRWETFNLFNTPAFAKPDSNIESPDVGTVRGTYSSPRIMQFALRFEF